MRLLWWILTYQSAMGSSTPSTPSSDFWTVVWFFLLWLELRTLVMSHLTPVTLENYKDSWILTCQSAMGSSTPSTQSSDLLWVVWFFLLWHQPMHDLSKGPLWWAIWLLWPLRTTNINGSWLANQQWGRPLHRLCSLRPVCFLWVVWLLLLLWNCELHIWLLWL